MADDRPTFAGHVLATDTPQTPRAAAAVDPWAEFNPVPATAGSTQADPWAEFNPTPAGGASPPAAKAPGIDWKSGAITLPQPIQDFGDVMGERASAGFMLPAQALTGGAPDAATAKTQYDAAKQRLGPVGSTVADTLGYWASPPNWVLNRVPGGGAIGGAAQRRPEELQRGR